MKESITSTA